MPSWMNTPVQPCGTPAAHRRHYRHREPPCGACRQAQRRDLADRRGQRAGAQTPDTREVRNGLPEFVGYVYKGTGRDVLTGWM